MVRQRSIAIAAIAAAVVLFGLSPLFLLMPSAAQRAAAPSATPSSTPSSTPSPTWNLSGTARQADGKPLAGVAVSAKAAGTTVTTTVFTDQQGAFYFPVLPAARYKVWGQAEGYATARADATVDAGGHARQALTLQPIDDPIMQVSGSEWLAALPSATKEQRRMKEIFRANCTQCHTHGAVLQQRFDEQGWGALIDLMLRINAVPTFNAQNDRHTTIAHHRAELAAWLASVRGPNSPPLKFTLHPRPTGEAARVVITDWDIPAGDYADGLAWFDGSDWSEGVATSGARNANLHDVVTDNDGNAWITTLGSAGDRSVVKLDIRTAQVTAFKVPGPTGAARTSHVIARDDTGILWFDMFGVEGRIDPATDTIDVLVPPPNMSAGTEISTDVDGKGKVWTSTRFGAIRYDPDTKAWSYFQNVHPLDGLSYGNAGDADGNGWWAQFQADRVGKGDPRTGQSYEVIMRPPWVKDDEDVQTPADKEFYRSIGALTWGKINMIPGAQAPRRMGADKHGDALWVGNYLGNNLARINIRTLQTRYYRLPFEGHPYKVDVDRNHNAWTNLHSDDRILRLNPDSGQWTEFRMPGNGCEARHIYVDQGRNEVWVPCHRTLKVERMQFRSEEELAALARPGASAAAAPAIPPMFAPVVPRPVQEIGAAKVVRRDYDMKRVVIPSSLDETELRGRKLFTQRCAACHDPGGQVNTLGPWLDQDRVKALGDEAVRAKIASGSPRMPGFRYMFQPPQVDAIVAFLKRVTPAQRPQPPSRAGSEGTRGASIQRN